MSKDDFKLCMDIARATRLRLAEMDIELDAIQAAMFLEACHAGPCPLRLEEMYLAATDDDSAYFSSVTHDIGGLMRHYNPSTNELEDCFVPRFAS